jgi:hypothetical protein
MRKAQEAHRRAMEQEERQRQAERETMERKRRERERRSAANARLHSQASSRGFVSTNEGKPEWAALRSNTVGVVYGWLSLILRLLVGNLASENKERGSKTKQIDRETRHDCTHKEEEGTMITFRALERS